MKLLPTITFVASAGLLFAFSGCNSASTKATNSHADHAEHQSHGKQTDMEKMKAELAKLSSEDAASAEAQHACPVSGEMLGTMGAPIKVDVNGETVWICCAGCEDTVRSDPEKYLAKIKQD